MVPAGPDGAPAPHGVLARVELLHSGKVRDVYADGDDLILVASDRISIYDVVLPTPIPDKGRLLTALSLWWFEQLADLVPNHVISATDVPAEFAGRAIRCRRLDMVPVECVARGYLTGGGLEEYQRTGAVSGVELPRGLVEASILPEPIFTPSTKAPMGEHDEPITFDDVVDKVGAEAAERAAADHPRRLPARRGDRRRPGHPGRRHQDRAGLGAGRHADPRRRGAHLRLVAVLAGRVVPAGPRPVLLRQAVRPRLGHRQRLGQAGRRPPRCRPRWSRRPGPATSTSTRSSPATAGSDRRPRGQRVQR